QRGGRVEQQPAVPVRGLAAVVVLVKEPVHQELELEVAQAVVVEDLLHLAQRVPFEHVLEVGVPDADPGEPHPLSLGAAVAEVEQAPFAADVDLDGTGPRPVQADQIDVPHLCSLPSPRRSSRPAARAAAGSADARAENRCAGPMPSLAARRRDGLPASADLLAYSCGRASSRGQRTRRWRKLAIRMAHDGTGLRTLDAAQADALVRLCELIVPGSTRVGPVLYIDALLAQMPPPMQDAVR